MSDIDKNSWVQWGAPADSVLEDDRSWLERGQLKMFRFISALAAFGLAIIALFELMAGVTFPWYDLINGLFFGVLILLSFLRPNLLKLLMWLGLASFFVNTVAEFRLWPNEVIAPFHVLLPLLVLYGALFGDIRMSVVALVGVLGCYAFTWSCHRGEFDRCNALILSNLCVAGFFSGVAALGVWLHHCSLVRKLDKQTKRLSNELEARLRIQAMVTHDIRNPLMTLLHATVLDDRQCIQSMAERISEIVKSATGLTAGSKIIPSTVIIKDIWGYILQTFSVKLADKAQTINTRGDEHLSVLADLTVLSNSILGNFISNAIKFSPRGSTIEIAVEPVDDFVRIAVYDQGPGLPSELVQNGAKSLYQSQPGTDGEEGTGYGLRIAALCATRMDGRIEIKNHDGGGAVAVLLPRA